MVFARYTGVESWFTTPLLRAHWGHSFVAKVLPPISTAGMVEEDAARLAVHAHTVVQQAVLALGPHTHRD